jgi:hypothetical protein
MINANEMERERFFIVVGPNPIAKTIKSLSSIDGECTNNQNVPIK